METPLVFRGPVKEIPALEVVFRWAPLGDAAETVHIAAPRGAPNGQADRGVMSMRHIRDSCRINANRPSSQHQWQVGWPPPLSRRMQAPEQKSQAGGDLLDDQPSMFSFDPEAMMSDAPQLSQGVADSVHRCGVRRSTISDVVTQNCYRSAFCYENAACLRSVLACVSPCSLRIEVMTRQVRDGYCRTRSRRIWIAASISSTLEDLERHGLRPGGPRPS